MKMHSQPWITGNVPGSKLATIVDESGAVRIIKRAKKAAIVVGAEADEKVINYVKKMQKFGITIIPSCNSSKFFEKIQCRSILEVVKEVREEEKYDLIIFIGMRYFFASQLLSALKDSNAKTLDISGKFQPNASYSFDNLTEEEWEEKMEKLVKLLEVS